jgi:hypothetical protein
LKGKVERFYWREIFKTYCELLLEYYGHNFENAYCLSSENVMLEEFKQA